MPKKYSFPYPGVCEGGREQPALLPGRESDVARGAASHRADPRRATTEIRRSQAHDVREASTIFISVVDPDPGSLSFLTPRSGIGKDQDPNPDEDPDPG
jgi:hypothetical protein